MSSSGNRGKTEPVGGHRRPTPRARAYGKPTPPHAKRPETLFIPGLTIDAALTIAGTLAVCDVEPGLEEWSLPNRRRLHSRKEVLTGLGERASPAARVEWLVGVPYVGRAALARVVHAKPGHDPFESLSGAHITLGAQSVLASLREVRPGFTAVGGRGVEKFTYQQSAATAHVPVVVRTLPVLDMARNVVLSDPTMHLAVRRHVAEIAVSTTFAIHPDRQNTLFGSLPEHGDTIGGDAGQLITEVIGAADADVMVPVASSLLLRQAWRVSDAAGAA